jgi:hypothetical protein
MYDILLNKLNCCYDSVMYKKQYLIYDSVLVPYKNKYSIHPFVRCHLCPIWPPVFPLNLTFDISFATFMRSHEQTCPIYRLLTFHVPNLMFIFLSQDHLTKKILSPMAFCNNLISYGEEFSAQPQRWSATAYAIHSQPTAISGGHLLH